MPYVPENPIEVTRKVDEPDAAVTRWLRSVRTDAYFTAFVGPIFVAR